MMKPIGYKTSKLGHKGVKRSKSNIKVIENMSHFGGTPNIGRRKSI